MILKNLSRLPQKIVEFFKGVLNELKQVEWLGKGKTFRYAVIMFVILAAATLFLLFADQIFTALRNLILFGI